MNLPQRAEQKMDSKFVETCAYSIEVFNSTFQKGVEELVLPIQQIEFGVPVTREGQPDLVDIEGTFQRGKGNFWVAVAGEKVIGSVGIVDIGNRQVALKKMFVHAAYRGHDKGVAAKLLHSVFNWCKENSIEEIFLGTVDVLKAAHRFYEKNGFAEIARSELPGAFPIVEVDTKFFKATLFE